MNRARLSKIGVAFLVTAVSAVVLFNLPKVFPPSNDNAGSKSRPSISHAGAVDKRVVEKNSVKQVISKNNNAEEQLLFIRADPEEEQANKRNENIPKIDGLLQSPLNVADLPEILVDNDERKIRKPASPHNKYGNISEKDEIEGKNNLEESLKTDSSCGYQVFATCPVPILLFCFLGFTNCYLKTELSVWKRRVHKRSPCAS